MSDPAIWKDTTIRSRGREDAPATAWSYENKHLRISVMTSHRDDPGQWVMHCFQIGIEKKRIGVPPATLPEVAQEVAMSIVRNTLNLMRNSLPE